MRALCIIDGVAGVRSSTAPAAEAVPLRRLLPRRGPRSHHRILVDRFHRSRKSRQTGVGGSNDTYRSIVNLGQVLSCSGTDFTIADPETSSLRSDSAYALTVGAMSRTKHFTWTQRNRTLRFQRRLPGLGYLQFSPSYADPLLSTRGIVSKRSPSDTRRHFGSFSLDLLPGNWIIPYCCIRQRLRFREGRDHVRLRYE